MGGKLADGQPALLEGQAAAVAADVGQGELVVCVVAELACLVADGLPAAVLAADGQPAMLEGQAAAVAAGPGQAELVACWVAGRLGGVADGQVTGGSQQAGLGADLLADLAEESAVAGVA